MISLFIDTSTEYINIAILKNNKLIKEIKEYSKNEHSIYTTSYLKNILDDTNIKSTDIDEIYVVNGPGSFTGVRIGVTIAKIYGYLTNLDITPVSSLKSLAISAVQDQVSNNYLMSVIPANKSSYYVGIYNNDYQEIESEKNIKTKELPSLISKYHPYIISNKEDLLSDYQINKIENNIEKIIEYYKDYPKKNCHELVPNYLKLPQAIEK